MLFISVNVVENRRRLHIS